MSATRAMVIAIGAAPSVPFGYLWTVLLLGWCTVFALAPPRPRRSSPSNLSYRFGFLVNELPFVALYSLFASTGLAVAEGDIGSAVSWVALAVAVVTPAGLVVVVRRALRAGPAVEQALNDGLGAGWRTAIDAGLAAGLRRRLPWARILFTPLLVGRRDVERVANLRYGDAGKRNLLDVYRHRSHPPDAPVLVYVHGGAFVSGSKRRGARPLLYRLASQGWVCISANYRLSPAAAFPDHHVDLKKVIVWARGPGREYGADPATLFVAGSSAGAHMAAIAALTANDPAFQPGFERADTSVTAALCLSGYYGPLDTPGPTPSSPLAHLRPDAPPFFLTHGDNDTVVLVDDARHFAERLRATSSGPVVYAELPGAQHSFDLFQSIRGETVVDAIEAFTAWVRTRQHAPQPPSADSG